MSDNTEEAGRIMEKVSTVARNKLRVIAEAAVTCNSSLLRSALTSADVQAFVDDIAECLVGVYVSGVERQMKAVVVEAKKQHALFSCLSRLWCIPAVRAICAEDLSDDVDKALKSSVISTKGTYPEGK